MSLFTRCFLAVRHPRVLSQVTFKSTIQLRGFASGEKLIDVSFNEETEVSTVTMQRKPVNGLNVELLQELSDTIDNLEKSKSAGMILTSAMPTIFSGGLDIMEMYKPKPERVKLFWTTLQNTWLKLYGSSFPTVAAINGHSPAGGCLLGLCCEYRVMVGPKFTIGLNETQLGIVAPPWFVSSMRNVIGQRQTELALTVGRLFKTDEALKVGLIDETATDKADAIKKAEAFLSMMAAIPPQARRLTKLSVRDDAIQWLIKNKEKDLQVFLSFVSTTQVQQGLEMYLEMLKMKKQ